MFVAFLFDSSNLTFILNMVLLGVVLVVIAYALFSMLKKALPQAFHFVFFILFLVVGLFFVKFSVNFIANYDLSSLQLTIPVDGAEIMVTTPLNTISELLKSVAGNDQSSIIYIALNDKDLNELIQSLAMLIVGYLAFFIYILDIILLAKPIGTLIYHLAFKWIFPKEVRKYKYKRRWKSFLIGLTKGTIAAVMFLTPFTSLVNSINKGIQQNRTQVDDGGIIVDQESYDSIMNWVDAYNDSVFAKVAFGLDKDGRSIDMIITDLVTSADYNGSELLFSNQIRTIADTAETLLAMGLLTGDGGSGIQTSTLLSKEFISSAIEVIKNSDFIMNLFSIVVNIAVSYIEEMDFYTKNLQFDDVDWKNELDTINSIYGSLYDAGIITDLADGNQFSVPFGDESAVSIRDAFKALDESKFLSRVIPAVVYSFVTMEDDEGNSSDLSLYLSDKWEDYENIKWGHELTIVYDTLYQLNGLGINFFESNSGSKMTPIQDFKFINGFFSNSLKVKSLENNEEDEETDEIIDKLMNNFNEVIIILTGLDENKNVIENREYETLFDSDLLIKSIDKLLPQLVDDLFSGDSETTSLIKRDDVESALGKLEGSDDYKKETYSLLKVCKELLFNDEFDLMNNADENILNNEYFQDTLRDISSEIDDSIFLRTCVPTIFEELLKGEDFGGDIPLSGADLNFRNISFAEEIPNLLDGYNSIMKIASSLDSDDPGEIIENLNTDDLANALKAVYNSKIINPEKDGKKNENFYKILDLIFDNQDFKDIGIYPNGKPEYDDLFTDDKDWEKEIEAVATVFANLKSDSIIKLLTDSENFSLSSINSEEIKTLFGSIDNSKLLSGTFGDLMDELVLNSLGIDMDENISFRNVTSWADEAECFANALDAFQEIGGEDFTNIDLLNSDPGACENLLINFASLQMFTKDGEYLFGDFIHEIMISSGDLAKYLENPTNWTIEDNYSESKANFKEAFKDLDSSKEEIGRIVDVIEALQNIGEDGLEAIMNGNAKTEELRAVTNALCEAESLKMIVFNIVDDMVGEDSSLNFGDIKLDCLYTEFLITCEKTQRSTELNTIVDIYGTINEFTTDLSSTNWLDIETTTTQNLLNNFASLQMFTNKEGKYVFGDFIHDLLTSSGDLAKYLKNPTDWTIEDNYSESRTDFEKAFKDLDCSKDEISNIIAVIDALQANGGLDSVMEGNKSINLSDVTTPLGEATSLRMVVFNIVDEMINDKDSPLKLGNIKDYLDTKFFINENDVDLRKEELNRIADIYDSIMDLGDFSSIEWLDIDPENETKPLLINFASLKILKENSFGKLLHDLLTAEGGALENYLKDPSGYSDESDYSLSKYDFEKASWVDEVKNDYPEIDKFVSVIKSIQEIGSGNDKPGTEGLNLIMSGNISEDELDSVTGALCNASSLRMVVYNVIDDMIKGSDSSFNLGEINLSYLNTEYLIDCKQDERTNELERVVKIFGEIKGLGDDLSNINWIDMNTTDTKSLLTDFASLKMLSKGSEYYFDDLVHDLLIKSGSLADYLRDYGSTAKNPIYLTSKRDFEESFTFTNSETEINNIIEVIDKLQTIGATIDKDSTQPGTLGLNRITSGKAKSGELGSVTEALCNASSLKMVVYNVINDTIKGGKSPLTLGNIDLNKANTEYLIDCDIDSRKEEVKRIVSIYGMTETDEGETFDVYNIAIDELLTEIHESHILNTFDSYYSKFKYGDDLTVFEQFIEYMLSQKGLSDYITYGMTGKTAKDLVLNVANNYCDDKNDDEWENDGEIYLLNDIIEKSKSLGGEFSDTELINLSSNDFKELMNAINKSKLTHNAVYYFFETTSNRMGITTFIRDENKSKVNYLLGNLTSYKDANDKIIEQCGKEIGYFADIIDMAKTGKNDTEGNAETFNFETGSIESFIKGNNNKSTTPLFNLLINSSIYKDVKADIVYGVFNSAGMADYIRGSNEDEKINTISSLFEKGLTADVEGASIDAILKQKGDIDFSKVSKLTDLDEKGSEAICNIIRNTKPEVNGNRSRAYFSSEIVAGMLTKATVDDSVSINWYDEDYKYLVDDVADQIKDILNAYSSSEKLDKNSNTFEEDCTNFKSSMEQLDDDKNTKNPYILDEFKLAVFKDYNIGGAIDGMTFKQIADVIINAKSLGL